MSKSKIEEALAIGWFIAAAQFNSGAWYYICLVNGIISCLCTLIIAWKEGE